MLPFPSASLLLALLATSANAQSAPADRQDAALAYAQCVRDNGYPEFPDPDTEGGFRFLIKPGSGERFQAATTACRDLAPEGMRDDDITPEELDALVKLSQCVRENGVPEFPDPGPKGNFDLSDAGIEPGDTRLEAAMATCHAESGRGNVRITIGG
jgi:hypothetical protein